MLLLFFVVVVVVVVVNAKKSQNVRFIGRQILFGAFMGKDSWHGVIFPAYQVVIMPECFTKCIPADGLELPIVHRVPGSPNM